MKLWPLLLISTLALAKIDINNNFDEILDYPVPKLVFSDGPSIKQLQVLESFWVKAQGRRFPVYRIRFEAQNLKRITYQGNTILPSNDETISSFSLFVSPILDSQIFSSQTETVIKMQFPKDYLYLDKSCDSVNLEVSNKAALFVSCHFKRSNSHERLLMLDLWTEQREIVHLENGEIVRGESFQITANYEPTPSKLSLALGLGPYGLKSQLEEQDQTELVPAIMLYGNFKISDENSLRFFSASLMDAAKFHNLGLYFASNLASYFDEQLILSSLLGVQYLHYQFNSSSSKFNEPLFPQGVEFTFFNVYKDNLISGGLFLDPASEQEYQNTWIRYGNKSYWELNYIGWSNGDFKVKTFGLSYIFSL